jgi:hypothetical protein
MGWEHTHTFQNKEGDVWDVDKLIKASQHLEPKLFDITSIDHDTVIEWTANNVRDYLSHYVRLTSADVTIPIILRSDGVVMDGWHRIIRALAEGHQLKFVQFEIDPPPDYNLKDFK